MKLTPDQIRMLAEELTLNQQMDNEDWKILVAQIREEYWRRAMNRHVFTSQSGEIYTIEQEADGSLSWDFSGQRPDSRIHALVSEIWRLKTELDRLHSSRVTQYLNGYFNMEVFKNE